MFRMSLKVDCGFPPPEGAGELITVLCKLQKM